jgi:molybdenum cofactor biosynthesis enzyme
MGTTTTGKTPRRKPRRPATTPEGSESRLISLAVDLAEKQLVNGTASSQVIVHLLKLATTRNRLEEEKLKKENLLLSAKVDALASAKRVEELFEKAIAVMRVYTGQDDGSYDLD